MHNDIQIFLRICNNFPHWLNDLSIYLQIHHSLPPFVLRPCITSTSIQAMPRGNTLASLLHRSILYHNEGINVKEINWESEISVKVKRVILPLNISKFPSSIFPLRDVRFILFRGFLNKYKWEKVTHLLPDTDFWIRVSSSLHHSGSDQVEIRNFKKIVC